MSIKITDIQRLNPAPCTHWLVTVDEDGVSRTFRISTQDFQSAFEDFPGKHKGALVLGWVRYRLEQGATLQDLLNVVIV